MTASAVDPGRSRIILVGTPAYNDPALPNTPVVANNIADLHAVLTDPDLGGFDDAHCQVARDQAGVSEIGDLLVDAAAEAEDLLLFYYSGHGMLGPLRRELYLTLAGTRPDRLAFTALAFDHVRDACLASRAKSRVVILDSCFSGRAIGETLASVDETVLGQIQVAGTYTLTSAPANRTALILPGERHTAFTGRLLALLRTGSPAAGPLLSLGDIYRHLHARLSAEGLPVPQQRGTETADLLGLVRNRYRATAPSPQSPGEATDAGADSSGRPPGADAPFEGLLAQRGPDVEKPVTLKFREAISGATVPLSLEAWEPCAACAGTGRKPGARPQVCPRCSGAGHISGAELDYAFSTPCRDCDGRGTKPDDSCAKCHGSGRTPSVRIVQVRIPAGVRDGQVIRLPGEDAVVGEDSGSFGDFFLTVSVLPHPLFGRVDDDLTITVPVTFPEAVLGAEIQVPTLTGDPVTLGLPPNSDNGRTLAIRDRGVPRADGTRGALLVTVEVAVPTESSLIGDEALRRFQAATRHEPRRDPAGPVFTLVGTDIAITVPVTFPEAVLGSLIQVPTPGGTPITLELSPRSPNGQTFRVPGEGGRRRGFRKSDLLVSIEIAVPAEVSDLARQALRRYQEAMSWHAPRDRLFLEARR